MQQNGQSTREVVLNRLLRNNDFPAMANTVGLIGKFKESEDASVSEFANLVLKDHALTSKVLKLVNSVSFSQFGEVTTISRAIILLGFESIKNISLTLMLFDQLQKNSPNEELVETLMKSFYSGILAQKIAQETGFVDREEAFLCALFHTFGKMMVAFAWPEKIHEIKAFSREREVSEELAAFSVLGAPYEEFGMTIAKGWNFPSRIVQSMHRMREREITGNPGELDRLNSIATFSNEITGILSSSPGPAEQEEKIGKLAASFREHYGELQGKLSGILSSSLQDMADYSSLFDIDLGEVSFGRQLLRGADGETKTGKAERDLSALDALAESLGTIDSLLEAQQEVTPESIFTKGIQEINNSILSSCSLNDIIRIALETMYRGMQLSGMSRVLFFIKDTKASAMNVRFGFGSGIEEIRKWFRVDYGQSDDLFSVSVLKQKDLVMKNIDDPELKKLLPEWYRARVSPRIFVVLLPITISSKPIGLFYIEGDREGFGKIAGSHFNYLKIIRDQAVVAIRQKQGY
ncbi:MAG: HDOD domain-containing protein [Thermodesulfovibrionales bacterium]